MRCHNCGASLRPRPGLPVIECEYCHVTIATPAAPLVTAAPARKAGRLWVVLAGAAIVIGGVASAVKRERPTTSSSSVVIVSSSKSVVSSSMTTSVTTTPPPTPPPPPPPALREVLRFGAEGTAPGTLTSPRALAVAPDGTIFVAETGTGRVHRFDATGVFQAVFTLPPSKLTRDLNVFGLAAGADGHLWVSRGGDLLALSATDGKIVRTVAGSYPETWYHGDVVVAPSGNVHAITDRTGRHDVVTVSPAGQVLGRLTNAGATHLAVDGLGTVFLSRRHADKIDVISDDGTVRARFAAASPGVILVDPHHRVYVESGGGLAVFDDTGRFLRQLELPPVIDATFDHDGKLVVLRKDGVTRYEVRL